MKILDRKNIIKYQKGNNYLLLYYFSCSYDATTSTFFWIKN